MEDGYKRLMAAVALSVMLPFALLNLGSRLRMQAPQPSRPEASTQAQTQPVGQYSVPVLMENGQITQMVLEEYVRGVVLAEMRASFDPEALKAQAVAARTYALRRVSLGDRHPEGAVCTDPGCCQAWMTDEDYLAQRGTRREWRKIAMAVEATAGTVLTYAGQAAETTYFSCSGGTTESAEAVWGEEIPYLQSVSSPGEEWAAVFSQAFFFTESEFAACLGRKPEGPCDEWFGHVLYTQGGGVESMNIGGVYYSGTQLRKMLGLNSTAFSVTVTDDGITVTCRGKGHRVGMSQYGADALGKMGYLYQEILQRYYPGTKIDKIGELG